MNFTSDAEIMEFTSCAIRARKIIIEEFSKLEGRPPNELEIQDLLKMVVVPFGLLKQQNGNSHFQTPQISPQKIVNEAQKIAQQSGQKSKTEPVMDIVKNYPELSIEGDKIVVKQFIKTETFNKIRDALKHKGWEYIAPRQVGVNKWEPGYFELKEGAKA